MAMMRFCPHCQTERPLTEIFCEGHINTRPCGWDLSSELIRQSGWRPQLPASTPIGTPAEMAGSPAVEATEAQVQAHIYVCVNGHQMEEDDLICLQCGADAAEFSIENSTDYVQDATVPPPEAIMVGNWLLGERINGSDSPRERYHATHKETGQQGVLTLYQLGEEPDQSVYEVFHLLPKNHVPELLETGRHLARSWHVTEPISGGSLEAFIARGDDWQQQEIPQLIREIGQALAVFAEHGLRHRDLRPAHLMIRQRSPLDIVIIELGSACLSEFDLEAVSSLDISRYSAPEILAGGVSAASDWWSLGIILLEQLTQGRCFEQVHTNAFLIQIMTYGVIIPDDLDENIRILLRGLLTRDRKRRWQWPEVSAWLDGRPVAAVPEDRDLQQPKHGQQLMLAGVEYSQPIQFALKAAEFAQWDEALSLLMRGELLSWLAGMSHYESIHPSLRLFTEIPEMDGNLRLMLALKVLNPDMPFIYRGEIITPSWLLEHADIGYQLINDPVTELLRQIDPEHWLVQLYYRQQQIRNRAESLEIALNENTLKIYLLMTSRSQLIARRQAYHQLFPDTYHGGLRALIDRQDPQNEELILLLSADIDQFIARQTLLDEAAKLARHYRINTFEWATAEALLQLPRLALYQQLKEKIGGFCRCGIADIDEWAEQFLLTQRLPLEQVVVMLSIAADQWVVPEKQHYVQQVMQFFTRKITANTQRGSLVRMRLTSSAGRIDLTELNAVQKNAQDLLQHVINRPKNAIAIDSQTLLQKPEVNDRLRVLLSQTELYQRDTGINGMYLGFPFLLIHTQPSQMKPRIAPLFLWPVNLLMNAGVRGVARLQFDGKRGAVRLNPALASLNGISSVNIPSVNIPSVKEWQAILDQLLAHAGVTVDSVMEKLSTVMPVTARQLSALPSDAEIEENNASLCCSAVLFHTSFIGQAIGKDLQQIAGLPVENTALEKALGLAEPNVSGLLPLKAEERYFVSESDPSQETVVAAARQNQGLLIEGPPGTGKSQTIVNLIADTIGRQKTALVICQKPAALEVVYKRLIASGLMNRIVFVHQSQKGRDIVQSVRSQIESVFLQKKHDTQTQNSAKATNNIKAKNWMRQRDIAAQRIGKYETQLDNYYNGLHQHHEAAGCSYRELMASLIALQRDNAEFCLDLPQLQPLFTLSNATEATAIIDDIVQAAPVWLLAGYEGSPLSQLHSFSADSDSCHRFNQYFAGFRQTEAVREQVLAQPHTQITIETLSYHQVALAACKTAFASLSSRAWQQFACWLPLFCNEKGSRLRGQQIINQLEALIMRLQQVDISLCDPRLFHLLAGCESSILAELSQALKEKQQKSFWLFLNPFYYARQRKLNTFFAVHGINNNPGQHTTFSHSISAEQTCRLIRNELNQQYQQLELGEFAEPDAFLLLQELENTTDNLRRIADLAQYVIDYPQPSHLFSAICEGQHAGFEQQCLEIEAAITRTQVQEKSCTALSMLTPYLSSQTQHRFARAIKHQMPLSDDLAVIAAALPTLKPYLQFQALSEHFGETHWEILRLFRAYTDELSQMDDTALRQTFGKTLQYYYYLSLKASFEHQFPVLSIEPDALDQHVQQLESALTDLQMFNREVLNQELDHQQIGLKREWEEITRLTGKRVRRLREFIEEGETLGLMHLRPVWLMTPDVVSQVLPLRAGFFDTVLYDEASQMPIEYALPTLYRGKQMIVSGDDKQMPPSRFFSGSFSDFSDDGSPSHGNPNTNEDDGEGNDAFGQQQEKKHNEWNYRRIGECPDLLHLARAVLPVYTLDIHYRSVYRDLINFSNHAFYERRLNIPAQHSEKIRSQVKPLSLEMVNGTYSNQTNPDEARAIVLCLAEIWLAPFEHRPSVGIVTFNQKQAQLIHHLLIARTETDAGFHRAYMQETQRQMQGEDMSLFVKNVENVQGDERDVILFSTTFGRNKQGTFRRNFGVLGQAGGERRLNVAITRARRQVIIFSSMPLDEISDLFSTRRKPEIPRDFLQGYLMFAHNLTTGQNEHNQVLLNKMCRTDTGLRDRPQSNDGFVQSVVDFLQQQGWQIAEVQQAGVFYFDCMIEDKHSGRYIIGIECDMPHHSLLKQARAREIWRASVLKQVVPARYRISVTEWFHQPDIARQKLAAAITQAFSMHNR
ncbi:DUF4011 domain-containing protein [Xenorhabdus sp. 5]|nr:DUF4011 domain-containing protein [Xenorhabdus sp. 5]